MIRTTKQALVEAKRRWGKTAAVEDLGKRAATKEKREQAKAKLAELNKLPKEERKATEKERNELCCIIYRERYKVGYISTLMFSAFHVCGSGDTWEEAFAQADTRMNGLHNNRLRSIS